MIDLAYSLVIEATDEPDYFTFFSPGLKGFSGVGHSIEDCVSRAQQGMLEHVQLLEKSRLGIPRPKRNPKVTVRNAVPLKRAG